MSLSDEILTWLGFVALVVGFMAVLFFVVRAAVREGVLEADAVRRQRDGQALGPDNPAS
ncbi:hypothetical protein [Catelliglobosispora koreensis]|uniref:hypothetical protein n=1 Tax=Catelliglobosispora koreensis TaxID=129052 RepID=UPI000381AE11|nr:hypothetical protein [Catelliglobosispora koreensis]